MCYMRPKLCAKLLCVVLTSKSLEICLYVVLELTPQESSKKTKFQKKQNARRRVIRPLAVVCTVVCSVGGANENQPETTEPKTACHTSARARMRLVWPPRRKQWKFQSPGWRPIRAQALVCAHEQRDHRRIRAHDGVSYERPRSYERSYEVCTGFNKGSRAHDGVPYERALVCSSYGALAATNRPRKEVSLLHLFSFFFFFLPNLSKPYHHFAGSLYSFNFSSKSFHVIDLRYVSPPIPNLFFANPCSMCLALPWLGYAYFWSKFWFWLGFVDVSWGVWCCSCYRITIVSFY